MLFAFSIFGHIQCRSLSLFPFPFPPRLTRTRTCNTLKMLLPRHRNENAGTCVRPNRFLNRLSGGMVKKWFQLRYRLIESALKGTRFAPLLSATSFAGGACLLLLLLGILCYLFWKLHHLSRGLVASSALLLTDWEGCLHALPHLEGTGWGCVVLYIYIYYNIYT